MVIIGYKFWLLYRFMADNKFSFLIGRLGHRINERHFQLIGLEVISWDSLRWEKKERGKVTIKLMSAITLRIIQCH